MAEQDSGRPAGQRWRLKLDEPPLRFRLHALRDAVELRRDVAVFGSNLGEAANTFRELQALDGGRVGAMQALQAVVEFCDRMGLLRECHPLMQLVVALKSAGDGAADPMLNVIRKRHAPPLSDAEKRQRGCLAAAMEALVRGGMRPDDAARWVASRSKGMFAARRVKTTLWRAVKSWRVAASGGNLQEDADAIAFRTVCDEMDQGAKAGERFAAALLRFAAGQGVIQVRPPLS